MNRNHLLFGFASLIVVACAARTDLGTLEESDSSVPDANIDVTLPDVTVDVTPPPPPPDDVIVVDVTPPPPPPDDASTDVIIIDAPDDAPVTTCPDNCTSNHECEQQCTPKLLSGRYCCDEQTNSCYAWSGKHCPPIIIVDAGFD